MRGLRPAVLALAVLGLGLAAAPAGVCAKMDEASALLERGCSLQGSTGWINVPSASVPGYYDLSAAIHRGDAKINLGLWDIFEGGIYFPADQLGQKFDQYRNLSSMERAENQVPAFIKASFYGQGKIKLFDQDWAGFSAAGGLERQDYYGVVQRYFGGTSRFTLLAGWGRGRFAKGFGGLSKAIMPGAEIILEYDGSGMNAGVRMLLAQNVVFNLAIQNLNTIGEVQNLGEVIGVHLLFGITYVERL
jgi:hypothetical protein